MKRCTIVVVAIIVVCVSHLCVYASDTFSVENNEIVAVQSAKQRVIILAPTNQLIYTANGEKIKETYTIVDIFPLDASVMALNLNNSALRDIMTKALHDGSAQRIEQKKRFSVRAMITKKIVKKFYEVRFDKTRGFTCVFVKEEVMPDIPMTKLTVFFWIFPFLSIMFIMYLSFWKRVSDEKIRPVWFFLFCITPLCHIFISHALAGQLEMQFLEILATIILMLVFFVLGMCLRIYEDYSFNFLLFYMATLSVTFLFLLFPHGIICLLSQEVVQPVEWVNVLHKVLFGVVTFSYFLFLKKRAQQRIA